MIDNYKNPIKIAVVGDVHDQWEIEDNLALKHLGVDLVLFVGDFGNESVEVVEKIASLDIPKAAVMGNHDAWYTATEWGRKKCPYDRAKEDWVQQQLDLLGEAHVGYGKLDFPKLNLSVVGGRPFTWGGPSWKNEDFYRDRFGINNFAESTARIIAAAERTESDNLIFLGHNGPSGLGDQAEDICGKDWQPLGGDHGDPDLAEAIARVSNSGKNIPLVTFGHMHHRLRHTKSRLRTAVINSTNGTIYLNSASVPRIVETDGDIGEIRFAARQRNFSLVFMQDGIVSEISLVWVDQDFTIISEQTLYRTQKSAPQTVSSYC
ncbi:MAG: TIGR04168 family protein [Prochloraceae cyanobacterium]